MTPPHESARSYRDGLRDLADHLATEYSGAVPPGQVIALVFRVARVTGEAGGAHRLDLTEQIVRRRLTERLALMRTPAATVA
jgi:hypothetical protein